MLEQFKTIVGRLCVSAITALLCLYLTASLAGCGDSGGTPQPTFNLTGRLVNATTQQPVTGSLSGLPGGPYTVSNGVINIPNIPGSATPYMVVVSAPGYAPTNVQVAAPAASGATVTLPTIALTPSSTAIAGTVTGTYTTQAPVPDVGTTYSLVGSGSVTPFGQVQETGSFQTVGFITSGTATGQLVLTNSSGTATLGLVGPPQPGFSAPPTTFQYAVTGSTGTFQGLNTGGSVTLALVQSATAGTGQFTITFSP